MADHETGVIVNVSPVTLGSTLAADVAAGATTLTVDDGTDFDAQSGGTFALNGATYVYTVDEVDNGILTFTPALVADAADGDRVDVWDTANAVASVYYSADVELPGDLDNADSVPSRIPLALAPQLTTRLGLRDPGTEEACEISRSSGGEWIVTDLPGTTSILDGAHLAPATVPEAALGFTLPDGTKVTVTTDGTAPAGPVDGAIWIDTNPADPTLNTIKRWDAATSAWQPVQYGSDAIAPGSVTTALLAAEAVTAANIAAGTVIAGVVDGTTIEGAQYIAHGTGGEILVYDGTPAAGNLICAVAAAAGSDSHGNHYGVGMTLFPASGGVELRADPTSPVVGGFLNVDGSGNVQLEVSYPGDMYLQGDSSAQTLHISTLNVEVSGGNTFTINGAQVMPPGIIQMFGGAAAPTGWLRCDGSSVLRATYPALFAVIGTTYGSVDGTHFTLPNFNLKFPRGNTPGPSQGADVHDHTLGDAGQAQINNFANTVSLRRVATPAYTSNRDLVGSSNTAGGTANSFGAALTGTTDTAGHVPAYTPVMFIIKT